MSKKWSCISTLVACALLPGLEARNIFVTSGGDPASTSYSLFSTEPFSFAGTSTGLSGGTQVFAGPGGKYYMIGRVASEGVAVLQGTFPTFQMTKLAVSGNPVAAALSPDGRRLVVVGTGVQVIDTATDTILPNSATLNVGTNLTGVAISSNSQRAYVVSQDLQRLTAINLDTASLAGNVSISGLPSSVSVSPGGPVYVTVQNAVYEFDAQTLAPRGTFALNGFPGPVSFTPDGRYGMAVNTSSLTARSAFVLDLQRRTVIDVPSGGFLLSKIVAANNTTAFAYSSQTTRIYQITLANPVAPALFNASGVAFENIRDIALSNEAPQARNLFVLTGTGALYRVDVATNNALGPISSPVIGTLSYAGPAATGQTANLLQVNGTQTVAPGANSLPLVVRAVDFNGVPLAGVAVQFSTTSAVTLSAASATTDLLGYAQTTVSVPSSAAAGTATVVASGGGQSATFTLNVNTGTGGGGGPAPAGTLQILRGQGQVTSQGFNTPEPLTVIVRDTSGNPVPNVPVTFTIVPPGDGGLGNVSLATDIEGIASASYNNFLVPLGVPYTQTTIAASTGSETVNFIVTTVPRSPSGSPGQAVFDLKKPLDRTLTVGVGDTATGAIEVNVGSLAGQPIPNVGIRLVPNDPTGPTATCRGGVPLSNTSGVVVCDVVGGGRIGEGTLRIRVGEAVEIPVVLRITAGAPSTVRITGGNGQTGSAGQLLPLALTLEVADAGGNLLSGASVIWEVLTPNGATLSQTSQTTDPNGRASTRVTLGQQPGLIQIRARSGTASATFGLTSTLAATQMAITSGNNQSAAIGQAFAPLTVRVTNQGAPVAGASIAFQVTSGSAQVAGSAITNASGEAAVTATAGQTPGPVVIQASLGSLNQTFNLTVRTPGPAFTASSFVNAAGYQPGISPGSLAVITAPGIATAIRGSVTPPSLVGPLPYSLSGVEVLFNGVPAPIYAVSNVNNTETVIVQVPFETSPGTASVTIRTTGGGSTTVEGVQIQAVRPGIFDYVDANGRRYAVALRPDGSYISSGNPARRGENIRVFVDGMGQTTPATATNRAGARDQFVAATIIAGVNNEGVRSGFAKLLEGAVGIYIVEVEIPANTATGTSINLAVGVTGADGNAVLAGSAIPII